MKNYKVKFEKLSNRELFAAKVAETTIRAKKEQLEKIGTEINNGYEVDLVTLLKQKSWNEFGGVDLYPIYWEGKISNGKEETVKDQVEIGLSDKKRRQDFCNFVNQFDEWEDPKS